LRSRRLVVCIIATNVAPRELLWRPNIGARWAVDHSFLQLYRSDATALRTHAWRRNRSFRQCSIRLIEKASVTNFIGKSIPRPDRFLSRDKERTGGRKEGRGKNCRREEGRGRTRRLRGLSPRAGAPHLQGALPRRAQRHREGRDRAIGLLQRVTPQDDARSKARSDHRATARIQNQDARPMACQPLIYVYDPLDLF
jgi:hypothetical protein